MSQRVVSLVLQWSRFYFIFLFFFSRALCFAGVLRAIRSSALMSSAVLSVGHLWNRRGRGACKGEGGVGRRKRSHHGVTQAIIHPHTHTDEEFAARCGLLRALVSGLTPPLASATQGSKVTQSESQPASLGGLGWVLLSQAPV